MAVAIALANSAEVTTVLVDIQSLQMSLRTCLNRAHGTNTPIYDSRYIKGEDGSKRTKVLVLFQLRRRKPPLNAEKSL